MKTIAKNANDFADLRTSDKGNCIYVRYFDYLIPAERLFE